MLKFENVNVIKGTKFHNNRFELYRVDDSLVKTYFHIHDNQTPFKQTIELRKEADPVYTLYNQFNKQMIMIDLEIVKDVLKFLNKMELIIDTSVIWE
jgi:hypothetical protein